LFPSHPSPGGDVNITDEDGDTPLYIVENIETARFLVDHGALVARQNAEGVSVCIPSYLSAHHPSTLSKPIDHLTEDFPHIAEYLRSTLNPSAGAEMPIAAAPSQHSQNAATEQLTSALMQSVQEIMERAEAEGRDPEEELRQAVSRTVLDGVVTGFDMSTDESESRPGDEPNDTPSKRSRMDDGSA